MKKPLVFFFVFFLFSSNILPCVFEISHPLPLNFNIGINFNGEFKIFLPFFFSPEFLAPIINPILNSG